ncbi:uncharacterized protein RCH25_037346 isoform 2-T2 [Pelodytes ibericus]
MNRSLKKVTFTQEPVHYYHSRRVVNHTHPGILQHYHPMIVKNLLLTSSLYRKLKESGILTTEQIGLLEIEETQHGKIYKLIEVLKNSNPHVFTTFCATLHECGYHQLAKALQKATKSSGPMLPQVPSVSQPKQVLNETILLHQGYNRTVKEEHIQLNKQFQDMRKKYIRKLQDLEERISLAKWTRDLVIKERNIIWSENEALENLNTELEALIERLQRTNIQSNKRDLGLSIDFPKEKARAFPPESNIDLIYR